VTTRELDPRRGATRAPSPAPRDRWWRRPFSADTWRRTCYILLAPPVSLVAVPLALLGGWRAAARLQRGLARRYLGLRIHGPAPHDTAGRVVAHAVLGLPLNLGSLALTAYLWWLVPANLAYPLRPGTMDSYQHSWGGPTLAGAWAVHAAAGVVFLFVTPWIVNGISRWQGRLARRLLGGAEDDGER
jgi:Putative sensor